jgi:O-antigen ligase
MRFLVTAILFLFYALALVVDYSSIVLFCLLLLAGIVRLIVCKRDSIAAFRQFVGRYWKISLAMAAPLLAVLVNLLAARHFDGNSIDFPSRLAVFILIFWAVQLVPYHWMRYIQWAFVIGTAAAVIKMCVLTHDGHVRYAGADFIPLNIFTEMMLLVGFFAASTVAWKNKAGLGGALLKVMALGSVLYATYISGTRGAWLTIPVLIVIACASFFAKGVRWKYVVAGAATFLICAALAWQAGSIVKERIAVAESDIQQYTQGSNLDTSLGIRLQLWKSSWIMFKTHPIFGVGVQGFTHALREMADQKIISQTAATFTHSHNDILFMMAKCGIFGLVAILGLYLVPAVLFARHLYSPDGEIRSCACMGLALSIGLMVLGLSDVAFTCWEIAPFYTITVAFLLAYIEKRQEHVREIA